MRVSKLQAPSFKLQGSSKLPIRKRSPSQGFLGPWALGCFWSLEFGFWDFSGTWRLEFGVSQNGSRWFSCLPRCCCCARLCPPGLLCGSSPWPSSSPANGSPGAAPAAAASIPPSPLPRLSPPLARHGCDCIPQSSKPQAPCSKEIPNTKSRTPVGERLAGAHGTASREAAKRIPPAAPTWSLEFGVSLALGGWGLELRSRQDPLWRGAHLDRCAPHIRRKSTAHRLARYDRRRVLTALRLVPSSGSRLATCRGPRPTAHALPVPGHVAG